MHLDAFGHVLTHLDVFGRIWTGFGQVWTGFGRVWKVSGGVWRSLEEFEEVFKQISCLCPPCPPELQEYEVAKSMDFGHLNTQLIKYSLLRVETSVRRWHRTKFSWFYNSSNTDRLKYIKLGMREKTAKLQNGLFFQYLEISRVFFLRSYN